MELKKAQQWLEEFQQQFPTFEILDPDGWDRRSDFWEKSWNEFITREQFIDRISASTCQWPNGFWEAITVKP